MAKNKTLKVLSTGTVAGMIAAAVLSSQAFAAVDAYSVKIGEDVLKYDKAALTESFLAAKAGEAAPLYEDFTAKLTEAKGFYAFSDAKTGKFVSYDDIQAKFLEAKAAGEAFVVDAYTESADAKVIEVPTVKKVVVKDGKVVVETETTVEEGKVAVKSVKVLNLKQIEVVYSGSIDKDEVEDEANYTLEDEDGADFAIESIDLDGNVAIINIDDANIPENQDELILTIDEAITGDDVEEELTFVDTTLPKAEKVEVIGSDTIKVTFSEPVNPTSVETDSFEVNGGDLYVQSVTLANNNTEAKIKLYSDLNDEKQVSVKVTSDVEDYAGFSVISGTLTATVIEDSKAPTVVGYEDAKKGEVTLIFNEDVRFVDNNDATEIVSGDILDGFFHTNSTNKAEKVTIDGNKVTLEFHADYELPEGTAYVYVDEEMLEDFWGNEIDKLTTKIETTIDETKPEVTKVEQGDTEEEIVVSFSEEVDLDTATKEKSNYTILGEDGKEVEPSISKIEFNDDDNDEVTITLRDKLDGGKYSIVIEDVEDVAGNKVNKTTKTFEIDDKTAVDLNDKEDVTLNSYNLGDTTQKIVVNFGEKMATGDAKYAIDDLEKYTLVIDGESYDVSDLYNVTIKVVENGEAVEIAVPYKAGKEDSYDLTGKAVKLQIGRVADATGNYTSTLTAERDVLSTATVAVDSFEATADDTIKLTFKDAVSFDKDDITLYEANGTTKLTPSKVNVSTNEDGNTVVTYTLAEDDEVAYDPTGLIKFAIKANGDSENKYGAKLAEVTTGQSIAALVDKISAELATIEDLNGDDMDNVAATTTTSIVLTFKEDIDGTSVSTTTFDVDGYDVTAVTVKDNTITLTIENEDEDEVTELEDLYGVRVSQNSAIKDANGNVTKDIDTEVVDPSDIKK